MADKQISGKRGTGLTGAAGEYFVAAELSLRGWLATVTIKNAPGVDVLAQNVYRGVTVSIQTKTASSGGGFQLNLKDERPTNGPNDWYVFVRINEESIRPTFYVLPRNIVAAGCLERQLLADAESRYTAARARRAAVEREWKALAADPCSDLAPAASCRSTRCSRRSASTTCFCSSSPRH